MKKGSWIVVAVLVASVAINVWFWTTEPEPSIVIKRDTVWKDSIIREPLPAETIDIGKTVYVKAIGFMRRITRTKTVLNLSMKLSFRARATRHIWI